MTITIKSSRMNPQWRSRSLITAGNQLPRKTSQIKVTSEDISTSHQLKTPKLIPLCISGDRSATESLLLIGGRTISMRMMMKSIRVLLTMRTMSLDHLISKMISQGSAGT